MPLLSSTSAVLALMCAAIVCTAVDTRHRRLGAMLLGAVMALAMVDTMLTAVVPPILWMTVLIVAGMGAAALARLGGSDSATVGSGESQHLRAMRSHRALSCIVMAALIGAPTGSGGAGHQHGSALPVLIAAVFALTVAGAVITVRAVSRDRARGVAGRRRTLAAAEPTLMSASMAVMFA